MRKCLFLALAFLILAGLGFRTTSAQLPGGLKRILKPVQPKATPAPSDSSPPATTVQPSVSNAAGPRPQAEGITLHKTRIQFWPYTVTSYQGEYNNVWSWFPSVKFTTDGGPPPSGGQYYVEVTQPGGAAWVKLKCESTAIGFDCGDRNDLEKSGTLATGVFPFAIKMRNVLEGTDKTLFTGRAKVEKVLSDEVGPQSAKKFVYYSNQDWNLPIGHVYINSDDDHLNVRFWVRGEGAGGMEAHLFYRGEEVGLFAEHGYQYGAAKCSPDIEYFPTRSAGPGAPQEAKWARANCPFGTIVSKPNNATKGHSLGSNPGEYEIKVLRNKRLVRSIKFSVGPGGKIVDNGIAASSGMGTWVNHILVPVTVIGDQDGTWDKNAWKTEAFYGHPLTGFTWPPQ